MNGHCNKRRYSAIFQKCINYINRQCLLPLGPKSIFNNTKFDIFGDKYLRQVLIAILRDTAAVSREAERGGGGGREGDRLR